MDKLNKKTIDLNYPGKRSLLDPKNHKVIFKDMEKPFSPDSYGFYYNFERLLWIYVLLRYLYIPLDANISI